MRIKLQLIIDEDGVETAPVEIAYIERNSLSAADLGLHLDEARDLLAKLQSTMIETQIAAYSRQQGHCQDCGVRLHRNGHHKLVYRTLFGRLALESQRYYGCHHCQPGKTRHSASPLVKLLPERTSPELQYFQTKFASLMSYGVTVDLLSEILPLDGALAVSSVKRTVATIGAKFDQEIDELEIETCPDRWERPAIAPAHPVKAVGIDGGYIKRCGRKARQDGWFEVMTVKTHRTDRQGKTMAYVQTTQANPARRFQRFLGQEGLGPFDPVTVISDGGKTVRLAQEKLTQGDEIILDWFHIAMRLQNIIQLAKGLEENARDTILKTVDRVKWYLWHGCACRAEQTVSLLIDDIDALEDQAPTKAKLLKLTEDFDSYIRNNRFAIVDYGERHRNGDLISSSFVESAINQVVAKRLVKKQQMAWSLSGAHALLQVRTAQLNGDLKGHFEKWNTKSPIQNFQTANAA